MSESILVVHGVGSGFKKETSKSDIAKLLNVSEDRVTLFDYSAYLDSIRWPRYVLFPVTVWARHNAFSDQVGDVTAWIGSGGAREKIVSNLLKTILHHKPKYIVAHSLGSVIAYQSLLKDLSFKGVPQLDYKPVFIGLGSPLHLWTLRQLSGLNKDHETHINNDSVFFQGRRDAITGFGKNPWKFLDNNINNLNVYNPMLAHDLNKYLITVSKEVRL